ncbi:PREDICTED: uncharacterized protein C12orf50 homolog [Gavialis gangeticus]|uniref:uncharacterized protein C12orf50 homolog n=1 Tax=Gavialis gangeticus TaxID=94835 RepID=UPI00092EF5CC|nr:PREDICTED: uncharacterized protein C12orf50 homolog [Gavialis gangeticus]
MEIKQKYNNISCFWETQPLGCVRISCIFHHSKPRNINGLFLPPSSNVTHTQDFQENTLHPVISQEPLKGQESTLRPIHPPLIINISLEEEEEEEQEENCISNLLIKTPADIEEERAIREICYKSGEYYRIQTPQENYSVKIMSSALQIELLKPIETGRDLHEGDGVSVPAKFHNIKRQGEIIVSLNGNTRTDLGSFENGGGDCYVPQRNRVGGRKKNEALNGGKQLIISKPSDIKGMNYTEPIKKHHFKGVKKKKWISEESKNSSSTYMGKAMHGSHSKSEANCRRSYQSQNSETASYIPSLKASGRSTSFYSPEPGRSTNVTNSNVSFSKESKLNISTDKCTSASYNTPIWRKRSPHTKAYSKSEKIYSEPRRSGSK